MLMRLVHLGIAAVSVTSFVHASGRGDFVWAALFAFQTLVGAGVGFGALVRPDEQDEETEEMEEESA
jgi:hypothetical protein